MRGNVHIVTSVQDQIEGGGCIFDKDYDKRVDYVMNKANYTFRCPHCKKMNLPDAEYCNYCGKAIGERTIERVRQRKRDFVMIGMEMDLGIMDDCFQIVFKKMLQDEVLMKWNPAAADYGQKMKSDDSKASEPQPKKRGRKPKPE
jgi:hypothetical protein